MEGVYHSFDRAFPGQNTFIIIKPPANPPIKFTGNIPNIKIYVINNNLINELDKETANADLVILHGLNYVTANLINKSETPWKFLWMILGAELYENPYIYKGNLYGEKTAKIKEKFKTELSVKEKLKNIYRKLRYSNLLSNDDKNLRFIATSAKRLKYCGSLFKEEVELLKKNRILNTDVVHQYFSYYPIEYFTGGEKDQVVEGQNILLGNSASFTNNHLEAFDILKGFNLEDRKIVTTLSYGDKEYATEINRIGNETFGQKFDPLINFMPLEDYNRIMKSCGIVIMNHYRQQAVGNILSSLWFGCKVYLNEKNPVFHYLNRIGCYIFSIEKDLNPENINALKPLLPEQIKANRTALEREISEKVLIEHLRMGITSYLNDMQ